MPKALDSYVVIIDPNMDIALALSRGLSCNILPLPDALADVRLRARFISDFDAPLLFDVAGNAQWEGMGRQLRKIDRASAGVMGSELAVLDRVAISLRLWAGCIMAAKPIGHETLSGPNTDELRALAFQRIDAIAATDHLFRAGVEAAPLLRTLRNQEFVLSGVPAQSAVRRYATLQV